MAVHPRPIVMALGALYFCSIRRFQPEILRRRDPRWRRDEMRHRHMVAIDARASTVLCLKPACFSSALLVQDHSDIVEIVIRPAPAGVHGRISGLVAAQQRTLNVAMEGK